MIETHRLMLDALTRCLKPGTEWRRSKGVREGVYAKMPKGYFVTHRGDGIDDAAFKGYLRELASRMAEAHAFAIDDEELVTGRIPAPSKAEVGAFNHMLLPDPFPAYTIMHAKPNGARVLYLCWREDGAEIETPENVPVSDPRHPFTIVDRERARIAFDRATLHIVQFEVSGANIQLFPVETVLTRRSEVPLEDVLVEEDDPRNVQAELETMLADVLETILNRNVNDRLRTYHGIVRSMHAAGHVDPRDRRDGSPEQDDFQLMTREALTVVRALTAINASTTEIEAEEPGKFANRKRMEKGLAPLKTSFLVRLVPRSITNAIAADIADGKPPRAIHWRRSHLRRYASGLTRIIPRHIVGLGEGGVERFHVEPNAYRIRIAGKR